MTAPNHIVGGIALTGVIASLLSINILGDKILIVITVIGALLPDIDHTKSLLGRAFYPISYTLQRNFGHRTVTHSILALVSMSLIVALIETVYFPAIPLQKVFTIAYASHLVLDMLTVQGVPLLYPFKRNPFVVPGNPKLRLQTNNVRHEMAAFTFFIFLAFFMKPLMANGFWTSYNKLFGTFKHVLSEYERADDLIRISFTTQHASQIDTLEGYLLDIDKSELTIIDRKKKFITLNKEEDLLRDFSIYHTNKPFSFRHNQFSQITADSLSALTTKLRCTFLDIYGSHRFEMTHNNEISTHQQVAIRFPQHITINPILSKSNLYHTNPDIPRAQAELRLLQEIQEHDLNTYLADRSRYNNLKIRIQEETDYTTKEILMEKFKSLREPSEPTSAAEQIQKLQLRIKSMKKKDAQRYADHSRSTRPGKLTLSGTYTQLYINGKPI